MKYFACTTNLATRKGAAAAFLLDGMGHVVRFYLRSTVPTAVLKEKQRLLGIPALSKKGNYRITYKTDG